MELAKRPTPITQTTIMSKQELLRELKRVNVAIDKKILAGKSYRELAQKHKIIRNLLNQ